jgi:ribosomal-protein-alanine N-acetyltransferase
MTARRIDSSVFELQQLRADESDTAADACADLFTDPAWSAVAVARLLAAPGCFALLAGAPDRPEGLVLARAVADECELLWIVVVPSRRRRGIGRLLLRAALGRAASLGAQTAFLEVAEVNHAAIALYGAEGFRPCGRRPDYYERDPVGGSRDALILKKALHANKESGPLSSTGRMKKGVTRTS